MDPSGPTAEASLAQIASAESRRHVAREGI